MHTPHQSQDTLAQIQKRYWRQNVRIMVVLLVIWAVVGLGAGVLFADSLNAWHLGGFPLGFWFAQQGSIIFFVLIVLVYALMLNRLDRKHHEERKSAGLVASGSDQANVQADAGGSA